MLAKKYLEKLGVKILLNTRVENYDGNCLLLANGEKLSTDNIIWTAGVKGAALEGMDKNSIGRGSRYLTDPFNNIKGYGNIYAIGDVALIEGDEEYPNGHPGVAQVALQQARNLADNFVRLRKNKSLIPFKYKDKGSMATIGRHRAVVDLPFLSFGGYLAWYIWMFVHLMALVGFRNRFMVLINWMWNYFTYDKALRLIIRPYHKPE
jgi:NADH dehydrogenase